MADNVDPGRCKYNTGRCSLRNTYSAHTAVETLMVLVDCLTTPLKIEPVSICTSHSTSCSIAVASPASPLRSGSSLYQCLNSSKIIDYRASTIAAFLCNRRKFPLIRANEGNYGVPRSPLGEVMLPGQSEAILAIAYQYRSDAVDGIYRPNKSCCFHASALRCVEVQGELDRGYVNGTEKTHE